jgi:hypothetical protein
MADANALAIDDQALGRVRFGRSRFLATLGGALFGAAFFKQAEPAWALCGDATPCGPSSKCCCCSGTACCQAGCTWRTGHTYGFNSFCWNVCGANRITCCDWFTGNGEPCICRENTGSCG